MNEIFKNDVRQVMKLIVNNELKGGSLKQGNTLYNNQREAINTLFNNEEYSIAAIILRLTVIDSLYSTNASYSYFSFDEMAKAIYDIGKGSREKAREFFADIIRGKNDGKKLFDKKYGIRKNLKEGGMQNSLLSKYAYYELLQDKKKYPLGFPIYDSLAREICPKAYNTLTGNKLSSFSNESTPMIEKYVGNLNELRSVLFDDDELFDGFQQFDILDAYLWRMGKFNSGNLSLLLNEDDYKHFINNITCVYYSMPKGKTLYFDDKVREMMISLKLPFYNCHSQKYMTALRDHWMKYYVK